MTAVMLSSYEALLNLGRWGLSGLLLLGAIGNSTVGRAETPSVIGGHGFVLAVEKISGDFYSTDSRSTQSRATQLAWGPGPDLDATYLYVSSVNHGVRRFVYDPETGTLASRVDVLPFIRGNGIAFHTNASGQSEMYLTRSYESSNAPGRDLSQLLRYVDVDGDGEFGSPGDSSAAIVRGIPRESHGLNQIEIVGDSLYVGSGTRTQNGALDTFSGDAFGESAYSGTILVIRDLTQVPTTDDAAGFAAYIPHPTDAEYEEVINGTTVGANEPLVSTAVDKLIVHSAGTRNPFGIAADSAGALWFTNNYHRVNNDVYDRSVLDEAAEPDTSDGPSNDDVHDQLFQAFPKADYGYRNSHWQNDATALASGFFAGVADPTQIEPSFTFDNLDLDGIGGPDFDLLNPAFNQLHVVSAPIGLGPHAAATGFEFGSQNWPPQYRGHAFVTRFNGDSGVVDDLFYRDIVLVDRTTGDVDRIATGFESPIDVLADAQGNLLVASFFGNLWRIRSTVAPVPVLPGAWAFTGLILGLLLVGLGILARARASADRGGRFDSVSVERC